MIIHIMKAVVYLREKNIIVLENFPRVFEATRIDIKLRKYCYNIK